MTKQWSEQNGELLEGGQVLNAFTAISRDFTGPKRLRKLNIQVGPTLIHKK